MALRLTVVGRHGPRLGTSGVKEFGPDGGTIGRSPACTWALPDHKRFLSGRHASIDFRSGSYYIVDTSRNGVYVNGADHPVGRGTPQRLFNGDSLRIGEYQIVVAIDDDLIAPLIDEHHVDPVDRAQRVEAPEPTGKDMVDAFEITGVGIEMMMTDEELETLSPPVRSRGAYLEIVDDYPPKPAPAAAAPEPLTLADEATPAASAAAVAATAAAVAAAPAPASPPPPASTAKATRATAAAPAPRTPAAPRAGRPSPSGADLSPFFRGARLAAELTPQQTDAFLFRLGQVMRAMILGLTENLHLQGEQRNVLKVSGAAAPEVDNPLRLAKGADDALTSLLLRDLPITPLESVREAFEEMQLHQRVLLKALRTALDAFLARLDPEDLEQKLARGRVQALIGAANRLKYWDHYKDLYDVVAHHPPGELPVQFLEDFADAYQRELADARYLAMPAESDRHAG